MKHPNTTMAIISLGNMRVQVHQHAQQWVAQIAHHQHIQTPKLPVFNGEHHDCSIQDAIDQLKNDVKSQGEQYFHQKLLALSPEQQYQSMTSLSRALEDASITVSFNEKLQSLLINHHTTIVFTDHKDAGWTAKQSAEE